MSATTEIETKIISETNWEAGAIGGLAGALVMAGLVLAMNPPTLTVAIPSLYGLAPPSNAPVGLIVHLIHGAVLGVIFSGLLRTTNLDSSIAILGAGVAWGILTWIGFASLLMPIWLSTVGSPASPPFPNFAPASLLWHIVYGIVLGGAYSSTRDKL